MQSILWLIQLAPSIYWLADWHADGLNDLQADWLTNWLIDWPTCWLTVWLTDWLFNWLTDWLTCWETEWLTGRMTDGLSETVMGRLVDCCRPVLLNLQANFLTMWVLPGLYHCFLTDLMMKEIWLTYCLLVQTLLPIMTEWIQDQGLSVTLANWLIIWLG